MSDPVRPERLGEYLRSCRENIAQKQADVAEKLNRSASYLSRIEKGLDIPSEALLIRLAPIIGADRTKMLQLREADIKAQEERKRADKVHDWEPYWKATISIEEFFTERATIEQDTFLAFCLTSPPSANRNPKNIGALRRAIETRHIWLNFLVPFRGVLPGMRKPGETDKYVAHQMSTMEETYSVVNTLRATISDLALHNRITIWAPVGGDRSYTVPPSGFRALYWMTATGNEDGFPAEDAGVLGWTDLKELPRRFIRLATQQDGEVQELLPGVLSTYRDYFKPIWHHWYTACDKENYQPRNSKRWQVVELEESDPDQDGED